MDPAAPLADAVAAVAASLVPTRVRAAFVTLGGEGAVLVTAGGVWHGSPPPTRVRSTVGAGDSSLAGFLLAESRGADPQECLRSGIRYGSAAAALPGTQAPTPADLLPGDVPLGTDKRAVIDALAARVAATGRASDAAALAADAWKREQTDETGLPGGIAIPHAKSPAVREATLAFARLKPGVDFGAEDGPADLVFLIAAPDTAAEEHLAVLSRLARAFMRPDFTAGLRAAATPSDVVALVQDAVSDTPAPAAAAAAPTATTTELVVDGRPARIVAVTACATGIAHTFMAADALTAAGKELGMVASDTASQTFDVGGVDTSMYDTVLINCDKAKEAFGAAALM